MPSHYDIDYNCWHCDRYLFSQFGEDFKPVPYEKHFCDAKCQKQYEKDKEQTT